ncbi:flagellar hook-associated protein FlgK [Sulfitobacter aestuarii]|uniref:Flagellar hook-associated protein 1 n=1 Tax=Sulfitobacter aestuarii TaxID=2161676 RepID=A0ABW5U3P3_9RHOB
MGISSAFNIARSGLGATALQADLVSRNIANADAPGHSRKSAQLVTGQSGEVRVAGVDRSVSTLLTRLDRGNAARLSAGVTLAEGIKAYTDYLGQPEEGISPAALLNGLNAAVASLSGMPGEAASQRAVVTAAHAMAGNLNHLSEVLSGVNAEVDYNLRYDISAANDTLNGIAALNKQILGTEQGSALQAEHRDRLDKLIDKVTEYLDVQVVSTADGSVNLYTGGGAELVIGTQVQDLAHDRATGRLRAGAVDITPGPGGRGVSGGTLAGLFALKSEVLPGFGAQLDALAGALVSGFETANPVAPGGQGLFTDAGNGFDPGALSGLAGRITVNAAVDPEQGGDATRLQSGGGAGALAPGDPARVFAMLDIFAQPVTVDSAGLGTGLDLGGLANALVTQQQGRRSAAEGEVLASRAAGDTIAASRANFQGVNIDDEMQKLLLIEQSYKANARVLSTVGEMMDTLLAAV